MLDRLKEYRDIISLVVFFLGGFLWVQAQFATKAALNEEKCLLRDAITLGQLQIRQSSLQNETQALDGQISERLAVLAKLTDRPSPSFLFELDQMKAKEAKKLADLDENIKQQQKISDDMVNPKCPS